MKCVFLAAACSSSDDLRTGGESVGPDDEISDVRYTLESSFHSAWKWPWGFIFSSIPGICRPHPEKLLVPLFISMSPLKSPSTKNKINPINHQLSRLRSSTTSKGINEFS